MADETIILTPEGYKQLQDELAACQGKRDEILERLKVARDFGDLSENSEYDDAKDEQSKNESRITELKNILASAKVSNDINIDVVSIGTTVEIKDGDTGEKDSYTIVGTTETDSLAHKISNESPVGSALMGHAKGDSVEVTSPNGATRTYTITKISR